MDPEMSYWRRQLYFLSSLGIFYIIIIALFAIPLLGTFVVILIKGALDLRYVIIAGGCIGIIVLTMIAVRVVRRLWQRLRRDGRMAGRDIRRQLLLGNPFEVSVFNGLLKFSCGTPNTDGQPALEHRDQALLSHLSGTQPAGPTDILAQLEHLSELKRAGIVDDAEFKMLKTLLIESQTTADAPTGTDPV